MSGLVLMASSSQAFQRTLEKFAAKYEAAGMKVSSSKSEAMVLNQKKVECSLQVGDESLHHFRGVMWVSCSQVMGGWSERWTDRLGLRQL